MSHLDSTSAPKITFITFFFRKINAVIQQLFHLQMFLLQMSHSEEIMISFEDVNTLWDGSWYCCVLCHHLGCVSCCKVQADMIHLPAGYFCAKRTPYLNPMRLRIRHLSLQLKLAHVSRLSISEHVNLSQENIMLKVELGRKLEDSWGFSDFSMRGKKKVAFQADFFMWGNHD